MQLNSWERLSLQQSENLFWCPHIISLEQLQLETYNIHFLYKKSNYFQIPTWTGRSIFTYSGVWETEDPFQIYYCLPARTDSRLVWGKICEKKKKTSPNCCIKAVTVTLKKNKNYFKISGFLVVWLLELRN